MGLNCDFSGTFLNIYEEQIGSYLKNFIIPEDYKTQILQNQAKLEKAYNEVEIEKIQIQGNLERLKQQYRWGHIGESEYLKEFGSIQQHLQQLTPLTNQCKELEELARLLSDVSMAWHESSQAEKNRIAKVLFEEVILDSGGKVVAVKPKAPLEPFFRLSFEAHRKSIASDPEGDRVLGFNLFQPLFI